MSAKDINYLSYADQSGLAVRDLSVLPDGSQPWADALKLSHCTECSFTGGTVSGGNENAIDVNRLCADIRFEDLTLSGGRQAAIVVKGGSSNVRFKDVLLIPAPSSWCDVLWDDWSDQSSAPSSGVLENVHREDGKPVRLVFAVSIAPRCKAARSASCGSAPLACMPTTWARAFSANSNSPKHESP